MFVVVCALFGGLMKTLRCILVLTCSAIISGTFAVTIRAQTSDGAIITGKARAKDGDSVLIGIGKGTIEVRLYGIDAPEEGQECKDRTGKPWPCGAAARKALAEL